MDLDSSVHCFYGKHETLSFLDIRPFHVHMHITNSKSGLMKIMNVVKRKFRIDAERYHAAKIAIMCVRVYL